jgi:N-acetylglucosaminyldiphosphoundecaprenol N-acetyl-beta-D-mannosaminyltransferase
MGWLDPNRVGVPRGTAGTKLRAHQKMRLSGFEWLYRLIREPRRLTHRYLVDNAIFVVRTLQQLTRLKSYKQNWCAASREAR